MESTGYRWNCVLLDGIDLDTITECFGLVSILCANNGWRPLFLEVSGLCLWLDFNELNKFVGYAVAQLVEALRYKQEGLGFDSQSCRRRFSLT
jgi:hypothetical protein